MKRNIISFCAIALVGVSIGALGLSNHATKNIKQEDKTTINVKKHKVQQQSNKKNINKKQSNVDNTSKEIPQGQTQQNYKASSQQNTQSSVNNKNQPATVQQQPQKTQGQINRERGYDPNGNPLLPGQDHAAGSNPDGSADDWVKGQDEWLLKNGLINPDGTQTQKGKDLEAKNQADNSASNDF